MEEQQIFRKKSLDRLNTPDDLADYLRVTGPGVWFALGSIILLLAGLLVWGIFGQIITSVSVPAIVDQHVLYCYVPEKNINMNDDLNGIDIKVGDVELEPDIDKINTVTLDSSYNRYIFSQGTLTPGQNAVILQCDTDFEDGNYAAEVVLKTLHPVSLIFSK